MSCSSKHMLYYMLYNELVNGSKFLQVLWTVPASTSMEPEAGVMGTWHINRMVRSTGDNLPLTNGFWSGGGPVGETEPLNCRIWCHIWVHRVRTELNSAWCIKTAIHMVTRGIRSYAVSVKRKQRRNANAQLESKQEGEE